MEVGRKVDGKHAPEQGCKTGHGCRAPLRVRLEHLYDMGGGGGGEEHGTSEGRPPSERRGPALVS